MDGVAKKGGRYPRLPARPCVTRPPPRVPLTDHFNLLQRNLTVLGKCCKWLIGSGKGCDIFPPGLKLRFTWNLAARCYSLVFLDCCMLSLWGREMQCTYERGLCLCHDVGVVEWNLKTSLWGYWGRPLRCLQLFCKFHNNWMEFDAELFWQHCNEWHLVRIMFEKLASRLVHNIRKVKTSNFICFRIGERNNGRTDGRTDGRLLLLVYTFETYLLISTDIKDGT